MLPPDPPRLSGKDFDPSTTNPDDDVDMDRENNEDEEGSRVELSSVEINILIYLYLLESNFSHTAFTLLSESSLPSTSLFQHFHPSYPTSSSVSRGRPNGAGVDSVVQSGRGSKNSPVSATFGRLDGKIARGELVRKLWKSLRWEEIERHVTANGDAYKPQCPNPFHLLVPHVCPTSYPSSRHNPPTPIPPNLRTSPPPRRTEVFPPPPGSQSNQPEAGPSRIRDKPNSISAAASSASGPTRISTPAERGEKADDGLLKPKRRARRNSTESGSRADSPARSQASGRDKEKDKEREAARSARREELDKEKDRVEKKRARLSENGPTEAAGARRNDNSRDQPRDDADEESRSARSKAKGVNGSRSDTTGADEAKEDPPAEKKRKRDIANADNSTLAVPPSNRHDRSSKSPGSTPAHKNRDLPDVASNKDAAVKSKEVKAEKVSKRKNPDPYWINPEEHIARFVEHREGITCVQWNPKNPCILATTSVDGTARVWEFEDTAPKFASDNVTPIPQIIKLANPGKKATIIKHTSVDSSAKAVKSMSWHPEGSVFATASEDGVGRLFMPSGQLQGIMSFGRRPMNAVKFSPSGQNILCAKDDFTVSLWGMGQQLQRNYDAHTKEVKDVDWLDDDVFASAGNDHMIFVFHTSSKHIRYAFKGHTDDVNRIAWSPAPKNWSPGNDRLLASVSDDGFLMIWKMPAYPDEQNGSRESRSQSPIKGGVGYTGHTGTPGGKDGKDVKEEDDYFDGQKGRVAGVEHCVAKFCIMKDGTQRMDRVQWSPACRDGKMLVAAAAQDTTVKIYDVTTRQLLHDFKLPNLGVSAFAFSPLNILGCTLGAIVTVGWTGHVLIWDVETGEKRGEYMIPEEHAKLAPAAQSIAWRDDGRQIAMGLQTKTLLIFATPDLAKKSSSEAVAKS